MTQHDCVASGQHMSTADTTPRELGWIEGKRLEVFVRGPQGPVPVASTATCLRAGSHSHFDVIELEELAEQVVDEPIAVAVDLEVQ